MLKTEEHKKLWHYSSYKSPNLLDCSEIFSLSPNFNLRSVHYQSLGSERRYDKEHTIILKECFWYTNNLKCMLKIHNRGWDIEVGNNSLQTMIGYYVLHYDCLNLGSRAVDGKSFLESNAS